MYLFISIGLTLTAGLMSGLTVGYLSIDKLAMELKQETGTEQEKKDVRSGSRLGGEDPSHSPETSFPFSDSLIMQRSSHGSTSDIPGLNCACCDCDSDLGDCSALLRINHPSGCLHRPKSDQNSRCRFTRHPDSYVRLVSSLISNFFTSGRGAR